MVLRYSCTMLRYIQRKAKKSLAGKHPITKEFWNNGHVGSRLALSYLNCYGQAESRMPIIPKFFGPEILEFCPRSNQRKNLEFRAQLAARAQKADFSWKSDEVRTSRIPRARPRGPARIRRGYPDDREFTCKNSKLENTLISRSLKIHVQRWSPSLRAASIRAC